MALTARDINGCIDFDAIEGFADRVATPDFEFGKVCAKEYLTFNEAFRDTLENITDYRWDFGDGTIEEGQVPIPMITHAFNKGGTYPVTLTVINSFSGCERSVTRNVDIISPPQINFDFDTICARTTMHFRNLTTPGDGAIAGYTWVFPDGSTDDAADASYFFEESGVFPVSLISISSLGCRDTLTQKVLIKQAPTAGVEIPVPFVEAFIPVQMYDASEGDIVSYFWDFGDGNVTEEKDPIHTYDKIDRYPLKHAVMNTIGCSDTLQLMLDLNVYLDLPTAFSPNNDDKNDQLKLLHQGIKQLYTYKLYNRYGQEVFSAEGDVDAAWDGTYNGRSQPQGVYVAHVKALGAYGKEFNFKRNVTLLR
ncbi:PKD protein [Fulvivirga imtechensis AK7]|uniref:PKD protein n=1 Tax=Fulvivirga imtechensis AK7 TaxID=1237149 RepID=L8K049_9BACT|nr:PKD domain-containing protein [Fulvivirga imtechensis]ELR72847.1 PKD protein [Fulvivirga imtechensis AK7]